MHLSNQLITLDFLSTELIHNTQAPPSKTRQMVFDLIPRQQMALLNHMRCFIYKAAALLRKDG
jgi:hypothetical protein